MDKETRKLMQLSWKIGYDQAINDAEKVVSDNFDYLEPWLEPGEITKILIGAKKTNILDLIAKYIIETNGGETIVLKKGYKPALEELANKLGWSSEYHGDQVVIEPKVY